jgi:hypothetical protein
MDATSPIAARSAGQPNAASGSFCKPIFGMGFRTLVANCFVGRRWLGGRQQDDGSHRRYRDYHYRSAGGHGHAS